MILIYREGHGHTLLYANHKDFSMYPSDQYKKSISCLCSNINLQMLFLLLNKNKLFLNILYKKIGGEYAGKRKKAVTETLSKMCPNG